MLDKLPGETRVIAQIHVDPAIRYTCRSTGLCCEVFTHIPVSDEFAEEYETLDKERLPACGCDALPIEEAFSRSPQTGERILRRKPGSGSCVFHNAERKCALHSAFGPTVKPIPCRAFPFRYCETPGGVYVGLSFVCPTVRENIGAPLTEQISQLELGHSISQVKNQAPAIILLHDNLALTWDEYLQIEQDFLTILSMQEIGLAHRLIALNVLINFIKAYEENIHGPHEPFAPPHQFMGNELEEFLGTVRRTGYADILRVAGRSRPSPRIQRMFIGMLMSFANNLWQKRNRIQVFAGIAGQYVRHAAGLGGIQLNPLKTRVSHKVLGRTRFPEGDAGGELVERFLRHCIFRKDLVIAPTILRGINLLLLNAALIRWYAAAVCTERGGNEPELQDFSEGIRHVEMLYGFHSKFYRFFQDQPMVEEVVDSFTRRRNYPFIIMGQG
jgi:Fe-S-cluster containining protein